MLIDCETCSVRDVECADCVVTFLLSRPAARSDQPDLPGGVAEPAQVPVLLDDDEAAALGVLAEHGLVPPLRLAHGA